MRPLLEDYAGLRRNLPHITFATLPTPIDYPDKFAQELGISRLYVKRDDLTSPHYGGNKVRKLEFLLARAQADGARTVITFGGAGSNHALATALYARELGLRAVSILMPQPATDAVRRNLLMGHKVGAELHLCEDRDTVRRALAEVLRARRAEDGAEPMVIPLGGSSAVGTLGFVNAALELCAQLRTDGRPEPERIYVAAGTLGTSIGLALGLAVAGSDTQVVAIRVTEPDIASEECAQALFAETAALLHGLDSGFPQVVFRPSHFTLRHDFFGTGYGVYTPADQDAIRQMREGAGITLEGVYTGKAMAALIADARNGVLRRGPAMFWDTYNSRDFSDQAALVDYRKLPEAFHPYFAETEPAK